MADTEKLVPTALPSLGTLFSSAFSRLKKGWLGFSLIFLAAPVGILLVLLCLAVVTLVALGLIQGRSFAMGLLNPFQLMGMVSDPAYGPFFMMLGVLAAFLSLRWAGILWKAATHLALEPDLGFRQAFKAGNKDSFSFLVHNALYFLLMSLASMLLVIPGLVVAVFFGLSNFSFARDRSGVFGAFKQSMQATKPYFWPVFLRMLVVGLVAGPLMFVPLVGWAFWICAMAEVFSIVSPQKSVEPVAQEEVSPAQAADVLVASETVPTPSVPTAPGMDQLFQEAWALFKRIWLKESIILLAGTAAVFVAFGIGLGAASLAAGIWKSMALGLYLIGGVLSLALAVWVIGWSYAAMLIQAFEPDGSAKAALKVGLSKAGSMASLLVMGGFLVAGASLLGLIPGIILGIGITFAGLILVKEGKTGGQALAASLDLVRGRFWKAFGFALLISLAGSVLGAVPILGTVFAFLLWPALYGQFKDRSAAEAPSSLRRWVMVSLAGWVLLLAGVGWLVMKFPELLKSAVSQAGFANLSVPEGFESSWGNVSTLPQPEYIAANSLGALWVMGGPFQNTYMKIIRSDGSIVQAGTSPSRFGFTGPIVEDPRGFLYHSDGGYHRVEKLDSQAEKMGDVLSSSAEGLTQTVHGPMGMALDEGGNLYVTETENHRVQKVGPDGIYLTHWGHPVPEKAAEWQPYAVAAGGGKVYVCDAYGNGIEIFDTMGVFQETWTGNEETGVGGFHAVTEVALRPDGRILVSESDRVMEFGPDRVLTGMWVGGEQAGWYANGIAVSPDGRVFVLDKRNHRILVGRDAPEL